jgi:serine/threonine-protein kinase
MAFPGELGPGLFDGVLHEPAVPVTVARPDLPAGLVRIIAKAMAKDRDQRYSDVNSMLVALEDELMPPTPAPRLLTPQAGVPSFVARDARSGPHAPQAVPSKEPSGEHQGTRILFAFPLQTEGKENAASERPSGGNCGSKGGLKEAASLPTTDRVAALVDLGAPLRKTHSRGPGARFALRGWGGLMRAGLAVAIGFFGMSVAMRGVRRPQASAPAPIADGMPPAREPVVQPADPASSSEPVAVQAPPTISPSPPAPSARATRAPSHFVRHMRNMPRRLFMAVRESSNDFPPQPHALRGASERDEPAQAPSSARSTDALAKSPARRAGTLSKDDF